LESKEHVAEEIETIKNCAGIAYAAGAESASTPELFCAWTKKLM
jgi:hypothetical protein